MGIPFVDLKAQYKRIKNDIDAAIMGVVETTQFIGGPRVESFENNFAAYVEGKIGVGASSGTSALHLAMKAIGVGHNDEVITTCNTFIATAEAISMTGARPVFVDIEEDTLTIDPALIEAAITPKTKALVPVHLFGQAADMDVIRDIAKKHKLKIIADACQSHGARFKGSRKSLLGDISCYSFYPGKNLGAYGEGGMSVTDDESYAKTMRILRDHGQAQKNDHAVRGYNYRLDAMQAAVLDVKLKHLDQWTDERRSRAALYDTFFDGERVRPVKPGKERHHVYHLYVVRVKNRMQVVEGLRDRGIGVGIHYPVPLHLTGAYKYLEYKAGTFPVAEKVCEEIISLPMFPELTDDMVKEVAAAVNDLAS